MALNATIGFNAISPGDVRYQVKAWRLAQGHGVPVSSTGDEDDEIAAGSSVS